MALAVCSALPLGASFTFNGLRVSDDAYWKDFPRAVPSITPRLLLADAAVRRDFDGWSSYARVHRWQVLQDDSARIEAPYDRSPQVGVRETRRIQAAYNLSGEDVLGGARFDDVIGLNAWPVEMHLAGRIEWAFPRDADNAFNQLRPGGGLHYLSFGYSSLRQGRIDRALQSAIAAGPAGAPGSAGTVLLERGE